MPLPAIAALAPLFSSAAPAAAKPALEAAGAQGPSFTQFLSQAANEAAHTMAAADQAAIAGVEGRASLQEVADKLMAAERTLQTAVALRDRFVSSLQEISRLQI